MELWVLVYPQCKRSRDHEDDHFMYVLKLYCASFKFDGEHAAVASRLNSCPLLCLAHNKHIPKGGGSAV